MTRRFEGVKFPFEAIITSIDFAGRGGTPKDMPGQIVKVTGYVQDNFGDGSKIFEELPWCLFYEHPDYGTYWAPDRLFKPLDLGDMPRLNQRVQKTTRRQDAY